MAESVADTEPGRGGWRGLLSIRTWWRVLVWALAAMAAGAGALYFIYVERWAVVFLQNSMRRSPYIPPLIVGFGMIVICRLRDVLFPGTEGTGIPQAMAALETRDESVRTRLLSLRIALGKIVLLTLGLYSGATIGREGPSVHVAACSLYLSRRFASFPAHLLERGLIMAGGAAGIAAAFNAPIAGLTFAFEEIGRSFDKRNTPTVVGTVVIASLVCIASLSNYLFYGHVPGQVVGQREWLAIPVIGLVGGFLGGCFARAVVVTTPRITRLARRRPYMVAGTLGLCLAVLGLLSDGATYGGGDEQARAILLLGQDLPLYYAPAKAAASFFSLISSIPGGLFTPSLSVGAGLGQMAVNLMPEMNRQVIVVVAMGAYFCGVVQSPITAAVIMIEMTAAHFVTLPLLVATMLAYFASKAVCPVSLYEALAANFLQHFTADGRSTPPP